MSDIKKRTNTARLDGFKLEPSIRSKIKATDLRGTDKGELNDDMPPRWSFDGSSTQQAEGDSSDCLLVPVQMYDNPNSTRSSSNVSSISSRWINSSIKY